ncbi:MAG: Maf family protein [Pseudohongiella sp.]|uniref:nucleoside triphosphate pyrophosphatase n=1 Tax=Pseudohongiella sp. TaxID=1979412 RepID=UPI00349FDC25
MSPPVNSVSPAGDVGRLVLASASPRRRELLDQIGVSYRVLVHDTDETLLSGECPEAYVSRLARQKAASVNALPEIFARCPVLGADTIVVCDNVILGKPQDEADATRMLRMLAGRSHQVLTAVCVMQGNRAEVVTVHTRVWFRELSDADIAAYWRHGEPEGKAGAYAVQGSGALFVEKIEGSYSGVVGLPLFETGRLLAGFGIRNALESHA